MSADQNYNEVRNSPVLVSNSPTQDKMFETRVVCDGFSNVHVEDLRSCCVISEGTHTHHRNGWLACLSKE